MYCDRGVIMKRQKSSLCLFYTISPMHAGSGRATGVVDLPIQRERHTDWPHVQASALKGALRSHYRHNANPGQSKEIEIFGSDKGNSQTSPGTLAVSDAKLLAFPVRSNQMPFVWITSPGVLRRYQEDLSFVKPDYKIIEIFEPERGSCYSVSSATGELLLEDFFVLKKVTKQIPVVLPEGLEKNANIYLVHDEVFTQVVKNCTEISAQISIDYEKGTTTDGSLRYQEYLPSDTYLYSVSYFQSLQDVSPLLMSLKDVVKNHIQIGGDETLGKGLCKIKWLE